MHSAIKIGDASDAAGHDGLVSAVGGSSKLHRETVLMWCIGTTFGAAMITLLVAMCLAEVSIHRNTSGASVQPPPLASSR